MEHTEFQHEYDLAALKWLKPRGHSFGMFVTPRYRFHYESQEYERYTARLLRRVLTRCSLFIDVGANYGFFSLMAGTQHPKLKVIALEPVPETLEALRRSVEALQLTNISLHQLAAADTDGEARFHISAAADNCGFSVHTAAPTLREVRIQTIRLDSLLDQTQPCPTLVKVDVEGHELTVLKGLERTLARFPDLTLLLELNPKMLKQAGSSAAAVMQELERLGFEVFLLDDERCRPTRLKPGSNWEAVVNQFSYANIYCVRKRAALNVCFFSHSPHLAGAERSLVELVEELTSDYGVVCSVVVPGKGPLTEALENAGAACISADYSWWATKESEDRPADALDHLEPQFNALSQDLLPVLAQIDPDIVWTQTMVIPWGAVTAALLRKAHIWSVCEYGERDHALEFFVPLPQILQDILASSVFVYTCGRALGEALFPGAPEGTWGTLYRNVEVPPCASVSESGFFTQPGALRLGIFATLHESKGQADAICAVAELVKEGRNVELLLGGHEDPDYSYHLKVLSRELGVENHVRFCGFLSDRFDTMRESDVILICSRIEAFGRVGVEAMLLGKPVVYAAAGGLLEYMKDGETGLSYPPGDTGALARAIRKLADSPELRARLSAQGEAYARERFTRTNYGGEVYRKIHELLRSGSAPATMPRSMLKLAGRVLSSTHPRTSEKNNPKEPASGLRLVRKGSRGVFTEFLQRQSRSFAKRVNTLRDLINHAKLVRPLTGHQRRLRRYTAELQQSHFLDPAWYKQRYALSLSASADAALHYLSHGLPSGYMPNPMFDSASAHSFRIEPELPVEPEILDVRLIAFYLPQFHAIPENDAWWGEGFTEWTNVRRAQPQFPGHYQPHVPHPSIGYYDLNDGNVLEHQAALARRAGIHGFCFHHYWFAGKRLLEMPVQRLLRTGKPDFPFCLCWANENWTRRWNGSDEDVLIAQQHSPEDDARFIRDLFPAFADRRYIRVAGRPVLIVYRPTLLPEPAATFRRWREICRAEGIGDLYLVGAQSFDFQDPRPFGLDAAVEFPPHIKGLALLSPDDFRTGKDFQGYLFDYAQAEWNLMRKRISDYRLFRTVIPSWDNSARCCERGTVFVHSTPAKYFLWLRHVIRETRLQCQGDERMVFINAWNEWAEGCHLEPDIRYGFAWLNATRRALIPARVLPSASTKTPVARASGLSRQPALSV